MAMDLSEPNQTLFYPEMRKIIGSVNGCCFILFIYFICYCYLIFTSFIFFSDIHVTNFIELHTQKQSILY